MDKKERLLLRSFGQKLPDLVYIGKDGLTENVIRQIIDNLYAHELIKIKLQNSIVDDIHSIASKIEEECLCEVVCVIGSKILLYKLSDKPKIKHVL